MCSPRKSAAWMCACVRARLLCLWFTFAGRAFDLPSRLVIDERVKEGFVMRLRRGVPIANGPVCEALEDSRLAGRTREDSALQIPLVQDYIIRASPGLLFPS